MVVVPGADVDVFGDTEEDKPRILMAIDVDKAAYRHDSVNSDNFLSFVSVNGSRTGNVKVLHITDMSLTKDCRLKFKNSF